MSDAIPLLMLRITDEKRLPFAVQVPNTTTTKTMGELDAGKGKRFDNAESRSRTWGSDIDPDPIQPIQVRCKEDLEAR